MSIQKIKKVKLNTPCEVCGKNTPFCDCKCEADRQRHYQCGGADLWCNYHACIKGRCRCGNWWIFPEEKKMNKKHDKQFINITEPKNHQRITCPKCGSGIFTIFWREDKEPIRLPDDPKDIKGFYLENVCENNHKFTNADIMNQENLFKDAIIEVNTTTTEFIV